MSTEKKIGIVGMGTMGRNLALNFEKHGYIVSLFNRSKDKLKNFILDHRGKNLNPYFSVNDFVFSLEKPRCILIIIKSGLSVDQMITSLVGLLEKGDLIVDGGNSFYKDTICRHSKLSNLGIHFIGTGISGGELGALYGPAFMPGGDKDAYNIFKSIFKEVSASFNDEVCITHIGPDGSGHYVKMVHNGIEYADMQLISEAYSLLKYVCNLNNQELSEIFDIWDHSELNSYLVHITKDILIKKDINGCYLLDFILDRAENNETGKWISSSSLDYGEPLNIITESVFSRYLSMLKSQRVYASKRILGPSVKKVVTNINEFIEKVRQALYLCKIISYSQGFSQLRVAANKNAWNFNYGDIAKVFRSGCIIRAKLLEYIIDAYTNDSLIINLLLAPYFKDIANSYHQSLRDVIVSAVQNGIPMPAFLAAMGYYDSYRSDVLPANLIQAQRDYFGSHGYRRIDLQGEFHTNWL